MFTIIVLTLVVYGGMMLFIGAASGGAKREKKMDAIGVMLGHMGGNEESATTFAEAIGKKISALELGTDDALHFTLEDGSRITIADEGQSCCESRYMRTDDDLQEFVGAILTGGVIKDAPNVTSEYDEHEVQFLEIQTDRGVFTMASHNEHNGYYGGFWIQVRRG